MKIQLTLFWMRNMFHSHKHDFYLQTDKYLRNWILHLLDDHYYEYIKLIWRKPEKYLKFTITYFYHLSCPFFFNFLSQKSPSNDFISLKETLYSFLSVIKVKKQKLTYFTCDITEIWLLRHNNGIIIRSWFKNSSQELSLLLSFN